MKPSPIRDLKLLREGLSRLLARPGMFLGLTALSTALAALGPLLRMRLPLPADPLLDGMVRGMALLPMELYALPRMAAYLDAQTLGHPDNLPGNWQETFEARWWRATAARLLLSLLVGIGLMLCVAPGLLVLLAFGWGPTRTLLRGDGIQAGYRASAKLMMRAWPRAVLVIAAALLLQLLLLSPFPALLPEPALSEAALRSPWFWAEAALSGALGVWFASVALALFQALEADAATVPAPDQPPDSPSGK
ncbi:MAG: hypothetical protein IPL96_10915 [Holophagaceae bacterium]|nr:hypothetical protein [Holophagaceae bacterium]